MRYEVRESEPWLVKEELEDLRSRTKAYALRIITLFGALPKSTVSQVLGKQLLRSGTSVGANYREASRARSDAEFLAKIVPYPLNPAQKAQDFKRLLVEGLGG